MHDFVQVFRNTLIFSLARLSQPLASVFLTVAIAHQLLEGDEAVQVLRQKLLPHAFLITPNLPEAARLAEMEVTDLPAMKKAAAVISRLGAKNVLGRVDI